MLYSLVGQLYEADVRHASQSVIDNDQHLVYMPDLQFSVLEIMETIKCVIQGTFSLSDLLSLNVVGYI